MAVVLVLTASACAARSTGRRGTLEVREGIASYYGAGFHGKRTASGARFDMHAMVAAHPTYPFGTIVQVTNLTNGRSVRVRILDRGPAAGPRAAGVLIDLSYGAARALGFLTAGRTRVRLEVLRWGDPSSEPDEVAGGYPGRSAKTGSFESRQVRDGWAAEAG